MIRLTMSRGDRTDQITRCKWVWPVAAARAISKTGDPVIFDPLMLDPADCLIMSWIMLLKQ